MNPATLTVPDAGIHLTANEVEAIAEAIQWAKKCSNDQNQPVLCEECRDSLAYALVIIAAACFK